MKIGIFGGTFDPFTVAHMAIVKESLNLVDTVIIIPTGIDYYRNDRNKMFTFEERYRIINGFIEKENLSGFVKISRIEENVPSTWSSYNTLSLIDTPDTMDEIYFIVGSDSFNNIDTWRDSDKLKKLAKFIVVVGRDGKEITNKHPHDEIRIDEKYSYVSATKERERIRKLIIKGFKNE